MVRVEVVYGPVGGPIDLTPLQLHEGSTVADALRASGVLERHALPMEGLSVGVWFKLAPLDAPLRDRDRVEIYRPLTVDPKEARRLRYRKRRPQQKPSPSRRAAGSAALSDPESAPVSAPGAERAGVAAIAPAPDAAPAACPALEPPGLSGNPTR